MFEWIAMNAGPAAVIAAVIMCGAAATMVGVQVTRRVSRSEVPWLLRLGMFVALVVASFGFPVCVAGLLGLIEMESDLTPTGDVVVLGSTAILFAVLGASSLGYYFNRPWSRHTAVAFWPLLGAGLLVQSPWVPGFGPSERIVATAQVFVFTAVAALYFYRKRGVVTYYKGLESAA